MKQIDLYKRYIKDTPEKAPVVIQNGLVCHLTKVVMKKMEVVKEKVFITTIVIKHLYDKKPAEEFNFILLHLHEIVKYPEEIYQNRDSKRGNFCLVKQIGSHKYIACLEVREEDIIIATAFRIRKNNYLNDYRLLWNWRGGTPSS